MSEPAKRIEVAEGGYTLPVEDLLTGRGFCSGKSGSGKTNTISVIVEKLLDNRLPLLVIDTEGEYYPLKEVYEILLVGPSGDGYDREISEETVEEIIDISLQENIPVVVDLSEYESEDAADAIVERVLEEVFELEKTVQKPYLLVIEEIHEYVPEQGGFDSLAETVIRIAKRGRKRGLGICGVSQRPAAVSKEFITQCDWLLWHRLTWENDVDVARRILGSAYGGRIDDLETGEAFLMADWEEEVRELKFLQKRTYDAGSTPGLEAIETGGRSHLNPEVAQAIQPSGNSDGAADLNKELTQKNRRIAELEREVNRLKGTKSEQSQGDTTNGEEINPPEQPPSEGHEQLVMEFAEFLVYVFGRVLRGLRRTIRGSTRVGRMMVHMFGDIYRRQRYTSHPRARRAGLAIVAGIVVLTLLLGVVWLGDVVI